MRIAERGIATYEEMRRYWSLDEILDELEVLDMQDDADWMAIKAKKGK